MLTTGLEQTDVVADHHQAAGMGGRKSRSQPIESASRWLVGSSSNIVCAPENRIRASSTRRRWPPDRVRMGWSQHPLRQTRGCRDPGRLRLRGVPAGGGELGLRSRVRAHRLVPHLGRVVAHRQLGPSQPLHHRVQPTRRQNPVLGQHVQVPRPRILRQVPDRSATADRPRRRLPSPARIRVSVVFPDPLRPTSPILSPAATRNEACSSNSRAPARTSRSFADNICSAYFSPTTCGQHLTAGNYSRSSWLTAESAPRASGVQKAPR